jgi:hypothetical protein
MRARVACCALLAVLGAGCVQKFDATSLGVPATMASAAGNTPQGQSFKVEDTSVFAIWGLVTLSRAGLTEVLSHQLVGGKAVSNLKITVKSRWSDILITGITLGLIVPRTVTFEGVILDAAPPANP